MAKPRFEARWIRTSKADYSAMLVVPGGEFSISLLGQKGGDPRTITGARGHLEQAGYRPLGITNAGLFHAGHRPVGLFVEDGTTVREMMFQINYR